MASGAAGGNYYERINRPDRNNGCGGPYLCLHIGGCQNYGPFLGPYYSTAPII